jgi:alkylation response protein AidB-like acyl-CoA dehydrogenase
VRVALTAQQEAFRAEVRRFTTTVGPEPVHASVDEQFAYLVAFQGRLDAAGLAVVAWPEAYGGRGLSPVEYAIVCDELGQARCPEVINFVGLDVIAPALLEYISPERLVAWLPPMASGQEIWCQLFSEPDAGSDLASLRTSAKACGDGWVINGQKVWSTWAQYASYGLLLARTGTPESRHRGITAFVVDMETPGIEARPLATMTGSAEFAEVFFDNVELPADALVGEVDRGWAVAQVMLSAERGPYAIRRSTVLRAGYAGLLELARGCTDPLLRQRVAQATIAMEMLDLRIANVLAELTAGREIGAQSALTKLVIGQTEQRIFSTAAELRGLASVVGTEGDAEDALWRERYLYSRAATIYGGSQEIQRNIVGERLLGLPR